MDVSGNSGFSPQIIHLNRGFHFFNHPFWGFPPIFGNTHIAPPPLTGTSRSQTPPWPPISSSTSSFPDGSENVTVGGSRKRSKREKMAMQRRRLDAEMMADDVLHRSLVFVKFWWVGGRGGGGEAKLDRHSNWCSMIELMFYDLKSIYDLYIYMLSSVLSHYWPEQNPTFQQVIHLQMVLFPLLPASTPECTSKLVFYFEFYVGFDWCWLILLQYRLHADKSSAMWCFWDCCLIC